MGKDDSDTIWQTIENMRKLDASLGSFDNILNSRLESQLCELSVNWIKGTGDNLSTNNGWAEYAWWYTCRLAWRTQGSPNVGAVTFKIELWRPVDENAAPWRHARTPLIYVAFSPDHKDPWEEVGLNQYGDPWDTSGNKFENQRQESIWLWEWNDGTSQTLWQKRYWFYAVPLTALDSDESVGSEIVDPLKGLLLTQKPATKIFKGKKAIRGVAFRQ